MASPEVVVEAPEDEEPNIVVGTSTCTAADEEQNKYPDVIPEDWKAGRAARAQDWFDVARDASKRCAYTTTTNLAWT